MIILPKREVKLLRYLNSSDTKKVFMVQTVDYISGRIFYSPHVTKDILHKLISLDLVHRKESYTTDGSDVYNITTEGESYLNLLDEQKEEKKQEQIKWNIIVPIVVSIITTLLTSFLVN